MTIDEKIAVMQAFRDGQPIEFQNLIYKKKDWARTTNPAWNWSHYTYRVQPKPTQPQSQFSHEDIKPGMWIRLETADYKPTGQITHFNTDTVYTTIGNFTYNELNRSASWSTDLVVWTKCG